MLCARRPGDKWRFFQRRSFVGVFSLGTAGGAGAARGTKRLSGRPVGGWMYGRLGRRARRHTGRLELSRT